MINNEKETKKNVIVGIYKITSPSGKIYIGQSIDIWRRFNQYRRIDCSKQIILYNSLIKHSWESHYFEIIEECLLEDLKERETYWKQHYITQYGWNQMMFCELYDRGGGPRNEETKRKMSISQTGRKHSCETKYKIGNVHKNNQYKKGILASSETKIKMSISRKGKLFSQNTKDKMSKTREKFKKPILQYDLEGNFIQEFSGVREAGKVCNLDNGTIVMCCKGRIKKYKGYIWKYKNK